VDGLTALLTLLESEGTRTADATPQTDRCCPHCMEER
jgi:hypothetical protein